MPNENKFYHRLNTFFSKDKVGNSSLIQSDKNKASSTLCSLQEITATKMIKQHGERDKNDVDESLALDNSKISGLNSDLELLLKFRQKTLFDYQLLSNE